MTTDYKQNLLTRVNSVAYREFMKLILVELTYTIIVFIGIFTINKYFMIGLIFLSIIQTILYKITKNKVIRKTEYIINSILSFILLLSIINIYFYHLDSITFINTIL
jgi:hypothetical protein